MHNDFKFYGDDDDVITGADWYSLTQNTPFHISNDAVNSPSHYTQGKVEAIDVIEDAIKDAPNNQVGFLQGQVLKYLLRLWHKSNSKQDAEKARWYLNRLIDNLT